ncbi:hypothetical protein T265_07069 [Opisthorchis viverrini]|uniref:Uncharacterized protein n=1 Tax=Opisthorchis viverrini TaxID=6198 RepID=A0A075ACL0_OPIVI|nr:hypothetical protein T265_07069 [Opisthorchis viverrini]KER25499.1 hypothetical protein T265_07069 [Opisthorchis viverrini]
MSVDRGIGCNPTASSTTVCPRETFATSKPELACKKFGTEDLFNTMSFTGFLDPLSRVPSTPPLHFALFKGDVLVIFS